MEVEEGRDGGRLIKPFDWLEEPLRSVGYDFDPSFLALAVGSSLVVVASHMLAPQWRSFDTLIDGGHRLQEVVEVAEIGCGTVVVTGTTVVDAPKNHSWGY